MQGGIERMLTMTQVHDIRKLYFEEGKNINQIAKMTRFDRKTVEGDQYRICMNKDRDIVYYNIDNSVKFLKDHIKVPIWFKKNTNPKYACYCSKTTEDQVIEAVAKHCAKTVKEVIEITGAMKNDNCGENNPMGVCCHNIIQEAINKGLAMK